MFRVPGLDVSGDMRVRQEWNFVDGRDRSRSAVRARLRATYKIDDHFAVGARIATGDPDDPNSTDVTLGNFVDDFQVSLDQAWRSEEHTSELQSLMRISYAVFCLTKKNRPHIQRSIHTLKQPDTHLSNSTHTH